MRRRILKLILIVVLTGGISPWLHAGDDLSHLASLQESGQYEELLSQALKLFSQASSDSVKAEAARYAGNCYFHEGDLKQALLYYLKSDSLAAQSKTFSNLGGVYFTLGDLNQAQYYFQRAQESATTPAELSVAMHNQCLVFSEREQPDSALHWMRWVKRSFEDHGQLHLSWMAAINEAEFLMEMDSNEQALQLLEDLRPVIQDTTLTHNISAFLHYNLFAVRLKMGDNPLAFRHQQIYDSLQQITNRQDLHLIEQRHQNALLQTEMEARRKQSKLVLIFMGVLALLAVLFVAVINRFKLNAQTKSNRHFVDQIEQESEHLAELVKRFRIGVLRLSAEQREENVPSQELDDLLDRIDTLSQLTAGWDFDKEGLRLSLGRLVLLFSSWHECDIQVDYQGLDVLEKTGVDKKVYFLFLDILRAAGKQNLRIELNNQANQVQLRIHLPEKTTEIYQLVLTRITDAGTARMEGNYGMFVVVNKNR